MAKFNVGDTVKIVQLTDIDNPSKVYHSKAEVLDDTDNLGGDATWLAELIGRTATVNDPALSDYYEVAITLDVPLTPPNAPAVAGHPSNSKLAFLEQDLEKLCSTCSPDDLAARPHTQAEHCENWLLHQDACEVQTSTWTDKNGQTHTITQGCGAPAGSPCYPTCDFYEPCPCSNWAPAQNANNNQEG